VNETLHTLNLNFNNIGDEGALHIASALVRVRSTGGSSSDRGGSSCGVVVGGIVGTGIVGSNELTTALYCTALYIQYDIVQ
jgi:hypothetical protein